MLRRGRGFVHYLHPTDELSLVCEVRFPAYCALVLVHSPGIGDP
uniref:Uncharacterized protein n=1 Tax=Laticauda laticaudata TaxID=8630 RepID=A0A8C5RUG1_LATLA